jgi:hypothetical protein
MKKRQRQQTTGNRQRPRLVNPARQSTKAGVQPFRIPRHLCISGQRLKEANAESIRLGFSRNLAGIEPIPDDMLLHVAHAMVHYSASDSPPLRNIRLVIVIPHGPFSNDWRDHLRELAERLERYLLDVTEDAWAAILANCPTEPEPVAP